MTAGHLPRYVITVGEPEPQRVLLAEEHGALRLGMRMALQAEGIEVVAEAATAGDAVAGALGHAPDACVIALSIRGGGLEAAHHINRRLPATAVLVLSDAPDDAELLAALRAGAAGYMPRSLDAAQLTAVVRAVLAGAAIVPRAMVGTLAEDLYERDRRRQQLLEERLDVRFTAREWDVMDLLHDGHSTGQVAAKLGISAVTVRRHASDVARKLRVPNREVAVQLLRQAAR
jgi:two-component system nitrate/nitrite response regulator NarL